MILKNAFVFIENNFIKTDIEISGSDIISVGNLSPDDNTIQLEGKYIIPGLVDIHTHGCAGYDFSRAEADDIAVMQKYYAQNGITTILPTTVALSDEDIKRAVETVKKASENNYRKAKIAGINLEGPYLSPKKCGAHDSSLLKEPDIDFVASLGDFVKVVHVAPEYTKAFDFIKKFSGKVSVAHTDCDYETAMKAVKEGADHITHIFNAMNPLHHRNPGVIGAFFDSEAVAELICDCIHVHPAVLRMMFRSYSDRIAVISDSMAATGLSDGNYKLGNLDVTVKSCVATLSDGTLAGSAMNLYNMMIKLIESGIKKEKAVASVTRIPAQSVNIDDRCGIIRPERCADLVILNDDFSIHSVMLDGDFTA